jgi:hypothetical protein
VIEVCIHVERIDGDSPRIVWWADSPQIEGWSASANSLRELQQLVTDGLPFFLETDGPVEFKAKLVPLRQDEAGNFQRGETVVGEDESAPSLRPPSSGVSADRAIELLQTAVA